MFITNDGGDDIVDDRLGASVRQNGEEGNHAIEKFVELFGSRDFSKLTSLKPSLHKQTNDTKNRSRILIPSQHQIAHTSMIRQTQPRREHPIHQLLGTFHILPHGDQLSLGIINDIQRRNARAVISQQTFQTRQRDGGKVGQKAVGGAGILGLGSHRHKTMQIEQNRFNGPCVSVLTEHFQRLRSMRPRMLIRIIRHLSRGRVGGRTELTKSLELI
mmetsp:Transcript_30757/g.55721  ORF Transcript_30757/g.55721 Transcript_30757/m.55721 type:complete len:216 (-) Transcript_30757:445-1092(-)